MSSCCGSICSSRSRPGDEAPTAGPTRPGRETAHDRLGRSGRDRSAAGGERPVRPAAVAGGGPAADAHPTPGGRPAAGRDGRLAAGSRSAEPGPGVVPQRPASAPRDRKSTRLNSSHVAISYAGFCLKKKITLEKLETRKFQEKKESAIIA